MRKRIRLQTGIAREVTQRLTYSGTPRSPHQRAKVSLQLIDGGEELRCLTDRSDFLEVLNQVHRLNCVAKPI
jgi:hypothetical protein